MGLVRGKNPCNDDYEETPLKAFTITDNNEKNILNHDKQHVQSYFDYSFGPGNSSYLGQAYPLSVSCSL